MFIHELVLLLKSDWNFKVTIINKNLAGFRAQPQLPSFRAVNMFVSEWQMAFWSPNFARFKLTAFLFLLIVFTCSGLVSASAWREWVSQDSNYEPHCRLCGCSLIQIFGVLAAAVNFAMQHSIDYDDNYAVWIIKSAATAYIQIGKHVLLATVTGVQLTSIAARSRLRQMYEFLSWWGWENWTKVSSNSCIHFNGWVKKMPVVSDF